MFPCQQALLAYCFVHQVQLSQCKRDEFTTCGRLVLTASTTKAAGKVPAKYFKYKLQNYKKVLQRQYSRIKVKNRNIAPAGFQTARCRRRAAPAPLPRRPAAPCAPATGRAHAHLRPPKRPRGCGESAGRAAGQPHRPAACATIVSIYFYILNCHFIYVLQYISTLKLMKEICWLY